jgi:hypothetical protein
MPPYSAQASSRCTPMIEFFAIGTRVLPLEQEIAPEKSKTRS